MARQDKETKARPGPRPRGPFVDKRKTLTTRITEKIRLQLEEAAAETGRSLSQEIELRLERSFKQDDEFGGLLQYLFCRNFASLAQAIAAERGSARSNAPAPTWINDFTIFYTALGLWEAVMDKWFTDKGDDPTKEWPGALAEGPTKDVFREIGKNWDKAHKSLLLPQQDNSDAEEA